jgi:hypothetical protein
MNEIHDKPCHWSFIVGADSADFSKGNLAYPTPNKVVIEYWKQRGRLTMSAHLYNSANPNGGGLRDTGVADCLRHSESESGQFTFWLPNSALDDAFVSGSVGLWLAVVGVQPNTLPPPTWSRGWVPQHSR